MILCGTAAGVVAARVGAPYAGPGNRFYWVLHAVGLTPRELRPLEFRELTSFGIGLTDVAKHAVGGDSSLRGTDFDARAVIEKMERARPRVLGFVGKRAAREVLGEAGGYGEHELTIGPTRVWILPSTSGAARGFWDIGPWHDLARTLSRGVQPSHHLLRRLAR